MVGPVVSSPVQTGQTQNAVQTNQNTQAALQSEQESPRETDVQQQRDTPPAQAQENRAQDLRSPRSEQERTEVQRAIDEATQFDPQDAANNDARDTRGELLDVLV